MTEEPHAPEAIPPNLSDWERLADRRGPNLLHWLLVSVIGSGVMLFVSPMVRSVSVLTSFVAILGSPLIFLLGWLAGMSTFSASCESYRRMHRTCSLIYLLPVLLGATFGLGLLGGRYWWLFAFALAFLGHRKGTQRAWWSAVACFAFVFRTEPRMGFPPGALGDEKAVTLAIETVNKAIGRRSSTRDL